MVHVGKEFEVIRAMLGDVDRRRRELGPRVAARDIENALEERRGRYRRLSGQRNN
jgi:hypothetical protein